MLRSTLLTPVRIVAGKLSFGLALITPLILLSLIVSAPFALLAFPSLCGLASLFASYVTLAVTVALSLGLSMLASALTRRTVSAVLLSYTFSLAAFGGAVGVIQVLSELRVAPLSADLIFFWSPLTAFFYNIHYLSGDSLVNGYWLANTALSAMAALLTLALTVRVFDRRRLREA